MSKALLMRLFIKRQTIECEKHFEVQILYFDNYESQMTSNESQKHLQTYLRAQLLEYVLLEFQEFF